jgi:hypothetical protein
VAIQHPYPCRTEVVIPPRYHASVVHRAVAWTGAALTLGYLLPWAIAATRHRPASAAVAVINLFLGWTLVGWVVALVLACSARPQPPVVVVHTPLPPTWYVPPALALAPYSQPTAPEPTLPLPDRSIPGVRR